MESDRVNVSPCVGIKKMHEEEESERAFSPTELMAVVPAVDAGGDAYGMSYGY